MISFMNETDYQVQKVSESLINEFPDEFVKYRFGDSKLLGKFTAEFIKRTGGKLNPKPFIAYFKEKQMVMQDDITG